MNEMANDNFQYISQLMATLTTEFRSNRQETDKIELLLKRVAKQSSISYEKLGEEVSQDTLEKYNKLSEPNEIDTLINENYDLLYQIEQQRYIHNKISSLVQSIAEHFVSIKNFVKEQKFMRDQDLDNFIYENFESQAVIMDAHLGNLKMKKNNSGENLPKVILKLQQMFKEVDWNLLAMDEQRYPSIVNQIQKLDEEFKIKLLEEKSLSLAKSLIK
ncbi:hypothetical protein C6P45_002608 [Maudiozyma exigua]|uniref:Uncharacterized protein n=1 Tax=Maudiozyma exigua TaxID=34358 RepID=A0A9P6WFD6_MAUEX|nr:hypothetical protein C6P45_002608 [Kazachstania exigua]